MPNPENSISRRSFVRSAAAEPAVDCWDKRVTPEHYRALSEMGFVPHREEDGRLVFINRNEYRELVEAGKIRPGSTVQ